MPKWKYDGFISYSTRADGDLAPKIQDGLERLAKPWNRRRALKIFQDIDDLAATANLSDTLRAELVGSQTLVFLASPAAAASPWCNDELSYWIDHRPANELVVVLTDGTLEFDKDAEFPTRFDTSTAAPPAFAQLRSVPLYIDMRYSDAEVERLGVRTDPEFRAKLTKISAALHSNKSGRQIEPRDIDSMDLAEHRRSQRFRRAAVVSLSVLTVIAVTAAVVAWNQRATAIEQRKTAESQALAARSELELGRDPQLAAQLAQRAQDTSNTPEARRAMFAVASSPWMLTLPADATQAMFSRDGSRLLTSGLDQAQLWSTEGAVLASFPTSSRAAAIDDDGDRVVVSGGEQLALWSADGALLASFGDGFASVVTFNRDGTVIATSDVPAGVRLWDVPALERGEAGVLAELGSEDASALEFSADGSRLAVGGVAAAYVWAFDGSGPELVAELPHAENVRAVRFGDDNSEVITVEQFQGEGGGQAAVYAWDLSASQEFPSSRVAVAQGDVGDSSISADGRWLITSNRDGTATVLSTRPGANAGQCPDTVYGLVNAITLARHAGSVFSAGFDGDGSRAFTVGSDGVRIWSVAGLGIERAVSTVPRRGALLPLSGSVFRDAVIDPTGSLVLASGPTNVLWDLETGEQTRLDDFCPGPQFGAFSLTGDRMVIGVADDALATQLSERDRLGDERQRVSAGVESVRTISYAADGTVLTAGLDGVTRWDTDWNPIARLSSTSAQAVAVHAGADEAATRVAVVDEGSSTPRIMDGSGASSVSLDGHRDRVNAVAFSPDGRFVATASDDGTARLWDLSGEQLAELTGHRLAVLDVAFDPSPEQRLVTAGADSTVRIWDGDGREIGSFDDHTGAATSASFSSDGAWIVAAGEDGTVRIWPVLTDEEVEAEVTARVGDG
jgi:WD40 repeat protein